MDMCEVQIKEEPGSDVECISDPSNPSESPKRVDNQLMDRDMPATDLSNISATINTVNLMENIIPRDRAIQTDSSRSDFNMREFYEMQVREHTLRMDILKLQFETAKYNRDIAKLNMNLTIKAMQNNKG